MTDRIPFTNAPVSNRMRLETLKEYFTVPSGYSETHFGITSFRRFMTLARAYRSSSGLSDLELCHSLTGDARCLSRHHFRLGKVVSIH